MDKEHVTEHIKVNLPLTEQDYLAGNGEGVWVLVDPETKRAYDEDATGGGYIGILDNDSCYYPGLNAGELIPFEMRGTFRPVADFYSFLSKLSRLTPEGKALLMERIAQYQAGHDRMWHLGTYKTLDTSLSAMQILGEWGGTLTYFASKYLWNHSDRFLSDRELRARAIQEKHKKHEGSKDK